MKVIEFGWPWRLLTTSTVGCPNDSWAFCTVLGLVPGTGASVNAPLLAVAEADVGDVCGICCLNDMSLTPPDGDVTTAELLRVVGLSVVDSSCWCCALPDVITPAAASPRTMPENTSTRQRLPVAARGPRSSMTAQALFHFPQMTLACYLRPTDFVSCQLK